MKAFIERVQESIRKRALLQRGQSVLVAVSGGVDSMVLLRVLHELARENSWRLSVAHFNHRLRGRSSDADERLVVRTAKKMELPVIVERADVKALARRQKLSVEMAARKARHGFLAATAGRLKIPTIALAHHADDQLELFFLRLFRGSGGEGLAGMQWGSVSPTEAGIALVRPLLDLPKASLRKFAEEEKITSREDASNASLDIQRNRIRHELLPLLRNKYQPALDRTISRVVHLVGEEAEFVGAVAQEWFDKKNKPPFGKLPVAVQRRCLQLQLQRQNVAVSFELVERLRLKPGHSIKVSPDLAVILGDEGRLGFQAAQPAVVPNSNRLWVSLANRRAGTVFDGVKFDWRHCSTTLGSLAASPGGCEFFDEEKIGAQIRLRHWQAGDRFQPSGMKAPVKLQDLFVNAKIPRTERMNLILAETRRGEIFWVERLRIAEQFKLSAGTNRCLQWTWKRL